MKKFQSTHKLEFETAVYKVQMDSDTTWMLYRIGTCHGLWCAEDKTYDILAIMNNKPGNGHFNDVLEWFEQSCIRDKYDLRVLECWNTQLKIHLMTKRGFYNYHDDNLIKKFNHETNKKRMESISS